MRHLRVEREDEADAREAVLAGAAGWVGLGKVKRDGMEAIGADGAG